MIAVSSYHAPPVFKLLGHDLRWQLLAELAFSDHRVQELVKALDKPQNLVSYHLKQLRDGGLVCERRSSADSRDVYYHLDVSRLQESLRASGRALHPALDPHDSGRVTRPQLVRPLRVLFLCTHNSARSQMAEGLLRQQRTLPLAVFSAGSEPARVHPLAIRVMAEMGIDIGAQQSKHFRQFIDEPFDCVITVCDRMREICPVFPDRPLQLHWSLPDPAEATDFEADGYARFLQTAADLATRIGHLLHILNATTISLKEI